MTLIQAEIKKVYLGTKQVRPVVPPTIDFLLIGGGGGGSLYYGGGGGAGGVIQCSSYELEQGSYSITIGAGGCGLNTCCGGCNGGDSTFNGLTAYGGGGGGGFQRDGCPGGSGGGGGYCPQQTKYGGAGCECDGQGYAGANSYCYASGGGGGAGGRGYSPCDINTGGLGGIGIQSDINGTMQWYAGGGSGYSGRSLTPGANCGGTNSGNSAATNATICGAGGGGTMCNYGLNGIGGNGVFILRYPTACGYTVSGGNCTYTCGDYTIHCFTSDGTLTVG